MLEDQKPKSINVQIPSGNWTVPLLTILLIASAFFIGSLTAKVKQYENNSAANLADTGIYPNEQPQQAGEVDPISKEDWVRGDRNAKIALIEYSDLECPFCKTFHPTAQQAVEKYSGQLMWAYRHFPLDQIHPKADKEAEASECAGKLGGEDMFWAMTDKIFEVTPSNNGLDLETLPDLAEEIGLNRNAFQTCLSSGEMASAVEEDYQSGIKAGVSGTPGNILLDIETGRTQIIPGAVPFAQLSQAIDQMLAN